MKATLSCDELKDLVREAALEKLPHVTTGNVDEFVAGLNALLCMKGAERTSGKAADSNEVYLSFTEEHAETLRNMSGPSIAGPEEYLSILAVCSDMRQDVCMHVLRAFKERIASLSRLNRLDVRVEGVGEFRLVRPDSLHVVLESST